MDRTRTRPICVDSQISAARLTRRWRAFAERGCIVFDPIAAGKPPLGAAFRLCRTKFRAETFGPAKPFGIIYPAASARGFTSVDSCFASPAHLSNARDERPFRQAACRHRAGRGRLRAAANGCHSPTMRSLPSSRPDNAKWTTHLATGAHSQEDRARDPVRDPGFLGAGAGAGRRGSVASMLREAAPARRPGTWTRRGRRWWRREPAGLVARCPVAMCLVSTNPRRQTPRPARSEDALRQMQPPLGKWRDRPALGRLEV